MFNVVLICAMSLFAPVAAQEMEEAVTAEVLETSVAAGNDCMAVNLSALNDRFWKRRKSLRLGYGNNQLQNVNGGVYPEKFSVGLSSTKSYWLHKKPVSNCVKLAFDMGVDLNYTHLGLGSDESYTGPSGYQGTASPDGENVSSMDFVDIGSHYFSLGWAFGVSLTANPVAQLRVAGYAHVIPSAGVQFSGLNANLGFMPYLKYGCELSYGVFGLGVEWGTAKGNCIDLIGVLEYEDEDYKAPKSLLYSNYTRLYVVFRLGK